MRRFYGEKNQEYLRAIFYFFRSLEPQVPADTHQPTTDSHQVSRDSHQLLARRDHKELVREHLSPMVAEGALAYTVPEMENHPDQRYAAAARP
ncbi:MAG TPA: hypothetical protein VME42_20815 [Steroidobacteraceae bacterium]|nr:hypothetical protein [Steroidobacteraceae bacterium]